MDELALLREIVAIPSVSGEEGAVAERVAERAAAAGLHVRSDARGVAVRVDGRAPGPVLALVSHLDTVPPGEGWTRHPFGAECDAGRVYGRGASDAKAAVAAMICAAHDVAAGGGPERGRLIVLLGCGEETRHTTMPALVAAEDRLDAAVVGEPTNLEFAIAQRGLLMLDLVARGAQHHAAHRESAGIPAITRLARDLLQLDSLCQDREHPALGRVLITPTMLSAGVGRNVTPAEARAVIDVRSTPDWTHAQIVAVLRAALASDVEVTSDRLEPCATPAGSALLAAARAVRPAARVYGSPTCSDWVFVRDRDVIKCGPGTSRRSHTPDECVELAEVSAARQFYGALAGRFLA